jgi:hypothetical protein
MLAPHRVGRTYHNFRGNKINDYVEVLHFLQGRRFPDYKEEAVRKVRAGYLTDGRPAPYVFSRGKFPPARICCLLFALTLKLSAGR